MLIATISSPRTVIDVVIVRLAAIWFSFAS